MRYVTCNIEQCSYSFALKFYVFLLKYLYHPLCPAYVVLTHIKKIEVNIKINKMGVIIEIQMVSKITIIRNEFDVRI